MSPDQSHSSEQDGNRPSIFYENMKDWQNRAQAILQDLPPPSIPPLPENQASDLSKFKNQPDCTTGEALQKCADAIEKYDAESCKAHREEIDTLLVFAGLFSAVLTGFTIESYQWLQDDPSDAIISALSQIALAQGSKGVPLPASLPDAVSARINAYWFLSLIFSLSSALVAILCKQWVREFERHAIGSHTQFISIRQMKLEGFEAWRVAAIIATIPLLLQSGLALFALGLIELLFNLHFAVAIVVLIPFVVVFLFYAATTLLPALQLVSHRVVATRTIPQCPFKSAQSMLAIRALLVLVKHLPSWHSSGTAGAPLPTFLGPDGEEASEAASETSGNTLFSRYLDRWIGGMREVRRAKGDSLCLTPTSEHLQSWIALDGELCSYRNSLYTDSEYEAAIQSDHKAVPALAFFRGLSWLRTHIDQPGLHHWIWLSVWGISENDPNNPSSSSSGKRAYHGILHLIPSPVVELGQGTSLAGWSPRIPALIYATHVDFKAAFIAELFIHTLSLTDQLDQGCLPLRLAHVIGRLVRDLDPETVHALLHATLSYALVPVLIPEHRASLAVRRLLVNASRAVSSLMSRAELGCVIAAYIRLLDTYFPLRVRESARAADLYSLFKTVRRCLELPGDNDSFNPTTVQAASLETIFGSVALALDEYYAHLTSDSQSESDEERAFWIAKGESTYLRLLSSSLGHRGPDIDRDSTHAEDRLDRYIVPLAEEYARRYRRNLDFLWESRRRELRRQAGPRTVESAAEAQPRDPGMTVWTGSSDNEMSSPPSQKPTGSSTVASSTCDTEADDYNAIRVLALPAGLRHEGARAVADLPRDSELKMTVLSAPTDDGTAASQYGSDHDSLSDAEPSAETGNTSTISSAPDHDGKLPQSASKDEDLAAEVRCVSPESRAVRELRTLRARNAPCDADSGLAFSPAMGDALRHQEPGACAVAPHDVDPGARTSAEHRGDEGNSAVADRAGCQREPGDSSAGNTAELDLGTAISTTAASKGAQDGRSISDADSPAAVPTDVEPGATEKASEALTEDETAPHAGLDEVRASAAALGTAVSAIDGQVSTEYPAAPSGPHPGNPSAV